MSFLIGLKPEVLFDIFEKCAILCVSSVNNNLCKSKGRGRWGAFLFFHFIAAQPGRVEKGYCRGLQPEN